MRNAAGIIRIRRCAHSGQPHPVQFTDDAVKIRAECQRITEQHPLQTDYTNNDKTLHHNGEDVLAANQSSVKKCQPRNGH